MTFFPDIECKTLPLPHGNKEVIQNIAQHTNDLKPEFKKGVQDFITHLIAKAQTNGAKHGYQKGSVITGNIYLIGNYQLVFQLRWLAIYPLTLLLTYHLNLPNCLPTDRLRHSSTYLPNHLLTYLPMNIV